MNTYQKYRRLIILLLAVADEPDTRWAIQIIESYKRHPTQLNTGIIREAFHNRSIYRKGVSASRNNLVSKSPALVHSA